MRIELGEIEARLAELPAVREVVVLAREAARSEPGRDEGTGSTSGTGVKGDKRLVAYWVARQGLPEAEVPTVEELRDHLKAELPAYMVPSAFVKLEVMPLTPNGKVDRKALPAPDAEALLTHAYEAPLTSTEGSLEVIWRNLLGLKRVGRNDSFFDVGGNSLLLVSLQNKMRSEGMNLSIIDMMKNQTIASMASILTENLRSLSIKEKVVCLKEGDGVPLFIIHDASGDLVSYAPLVNALSISGAIYGISALAFDESDYGMRSVESISELYAKMIENVNKDGPYRLVGWCVAGGIAAEVAKRLESNGCLVDFVGMIDTAFKGGVVDNSMGDDEFMCTILLSLIERLHPEIDEGVIDSLSRIADFGVLLDECHEKCLIPDGYGVEEIKRKIVMAALIDRMWGNHVMCSVPKDSYMFSAVERELDGTRLIDTWQGREEWIKELIMIGGNHYSMMITPNVKDMADKISGIIKNLP